MSYLKDIYTILCTLLGSPPTEFQWEYTTATKSQYVSQFTTPLNFYNSFVCLKIPSMVSLVNDPRHEYKKVMTVEGLGNVVGGGQVTYLNLESNALLAFVANRLAEKIPVWFGCDVGQELDKSRGIMRAHLTVEPEAFGSRVKLNKKERLDFGESMMTHAMLFVGCHIENGKVLRLLVENSWGNVGGEKGYFVMTAEWFHEYLYQIVIDKSILNAELKKELDVGERIILPLFDPM